MNLKLTQVATLAFAALTVFAGSAFAADTANSSIPRATGYYDRPPVIVQGDRSTTEERITGDVIEALAKDRRLTGRLGVETHGDVVTLTGRLVDSLQLEWAEDDVLSVAHVSDVNDEITVGDY